MVDFKNLHGPSRTNGARPLHHCSSQRSRLDGWFANVGGDELSKSGNIDLFFLRSRDDNVRVWGVSSSIASESEVSVWCFFFVRGSIKRSPTAPVLHSFFVKDTEPVSCRCWSFKYKFVLFLMSTPPLQVLEVEVNWD